MTPPKIESIFSQRGYKTFKLLNNQNKKRRESKNKQKVLRHNKIKKSNLSAIINKINLQNEF